jgi:hypothetical protein
MVWVFVFLFTVIMWCSASFGAIVVVVLALTCAGGKQTETVEEDNPQVSLAENAEKIEEVLTESAVESSVPTCQKATSVRSIQEQVKPVVPELLEEDFFADLQCRESVELTEIETAKFSTYFENFLFDDHQNQVPVELPKFITFEPGSPSESSTLGPQTDLERSAIETQLQVRKYTRNDLYTRFECVFRFTPSCKLGLRLV